MRRKNSGGNSNAATRGRLLSPVFAEGAQLDVERPRRARLMHDVPDLLGDLARLAEELVRLVRLQSARPFQIDDRVDDDVGDVYAFGPEEARHRLRQHALRGFGRSE